MSVTRLETLEASDFSRMKSGRLDFYLEFPDGGLHRVAVHITNGASAKVRRADFDIFHTAWAFRDTNHPNGLSALVKVTAPNAEFGQKMKETAGSLVSRLIPLPLDI